MNGTVLLIFFNEVRLTCFYIFGVHNFKVSWLDDLIVMTILTDIVLIVHLLIEKVVIIKKRWIVFWFDILLFFQVRFRSKIISNQTLFFKKKWQGVFREFLVLVSNDFDEKHFIIFCSVMIIMFLIYMYQKNIRIAIRCDCDSIKVC